jgi:hypothetical protein
MTASTRPARRSSGAQILDQAPGVPGLELDLYARRRGSELPQRARHAPRQGVREIPDPQAHARVLARAACRSHRVVRLAQDVARLGEQRGARPGQGHCALGSVEELHAQLLLELADLLADRRVGDVQALGARRKRSSSATATKYLRWRSSMALVPSRVGACWSRHTAGERCAKRGPRPRWRPQRPPARARTAPRPRSPSHSRRRARPAGVGSRSPSRSRAARRRRTSPRRRGSRTRRRGPRR